MIISNLDIYVSPMSIINLNVLKCISLLLIKCIKIIIALITLYYKLPFHFKFHFSLFNHIFIVSYLILGTVKITNKNNIL